MPMLGNHTRAGTMQPYSHVAVAGQLSFPCSYGVGSSSVSVFQNGVLLSGSDINLTSGNAAVLTSGAAAVGDEITIQVQDVFSVADTYTKAEADSRYIATGTSTGGGLFKGDNGEIGSSPADIFRINNKTLTQNVTIDADENASCTGDLTLSATLTVNGTLVII